MVDFAAGSPEGGLWDDLSAAVRVTAAGRPQESVAESLGQTCRKDSAAVRRRRLSSVSGKSWSHDLQTDTFTTLPTLEACRLSQRDSSPPKPLDHRLNR